MKITFLQAPSPLTKTFENPPGESLRTTPYPFSWEFTSHTENFTSLTDLEHLLKSHAALGHCALKGSISRPLIKESRAGSTDTNALTDWVVLDLDGVPGTVDDLLIALNLYDVSHIVQFSASHGIKDNLLRAHVFMLLSEPIMAPVLKQWLIQLNHTTPLLSHAMKLTRTGNALSWPLDISACQNDKLIYIAPPVLKNIRNPLTKGQRIMLVQRKRRHLTLPTDINTPTSNRLLTDARITELRKAQGLPTRKISYKIMGDVEVMLKPDDCMITDIKAERGFVYFNLNGGNSWAYYHPANNPDYIHNFKGEPSYLTKELLPEYWVGLMSRSNTAHRTSAGLQYLAFCDRKTSAYIRGAYDSTTDSLELHTAKNETQLRDFAKQHGQPLGDFIPEWEVYFDPHDTVRIDYKNKTINRFQPTSYMLDTTSTKPPKVIPKVINKLIDHATGSDPKVAKHFINWLATIIQNRDRTRTAWVLHGTQGTGKGLLTANVLRPLFGRHLTNKRIDEFDEKFNTYIEDCLVVCVDEVQTKTLKNERGVIAKLKNFITEEFVSVRAMHANAVEVRNYTNWIFMSNMSDAVSIDRNDRRFNVATYQPNKLVITSQEVDSIPSQLQAFYNYLVNYPADIKLAGTVLDTADRETMVSLSEASIDTVGRAILEGNFGFFIEHLPTDKSHLRNPLITNKVEDYKDLLKELITRTNPTTGSCNIGREELRTLFDFVSGNMPTSPNKVTSLLKHHRIHMTVVRIGERIVRGISTTWKDHAQLRTYLKDSLSSAPSKPAHPTHLQRVK